MAVLVERIAVSRSAPDVLRSVAAATTRLGLPPPAALTGDWFGSRAVIAPSVAIDRVDVMGVFGVDPGSGRGAIGGGWIGYLSYPDAGRDGSGPRIPEAAGGWTDDVLRQDASGNWWYESLSGGSLPAWLADALVTEVPTSACHVEWGEADRDAHRAGVLACLDAITAGEVYQACVCTQIVGTVTGSPVDFFADAVARTAPARAAFVAGDWGAVASLSPELFLSRVGHTVVSSPIKGTLPLDEPASALRESVKDVAENVMIVDLVRNDLSRVAVTGSVTVPELLVVRQAPGVWHLVSTVTARVDLDVPMSTILDATFPRRRSRVHRRVAPGRSWRHGRRNDAESTAVRSVWPHRSRASSSTSPFARSSSTTPGARYSALAGASRPIRIRTRSGASACTRRRPSWAHCRARRTAS